MSDLISRQNAIDELSSRRVVEDGIHFWRGERNETIDMVVKIIQALPSEQPEPKQGHYIGESDGYSDGEPVYDMWYCSECDYYFEECDEKPTYKFCYNCGARLEG